MRIKSGELFAGVYNAAFKSIINHDKERWTFLGGRASCKSSFISICIIILIVLNPNYNALIIRRTAKSLRLSVFEQIKWAIEKLHIKGFTIPRSRTAALPITYTRANGKVQHIIFAGCDDPEKLKSIKVSHGYIAILWVEEKTEVEPDVLQNVKISALRGGDIFYMFESYNPPSAVRHWCNAEARIDDPRRMIVHTTYKDIPPSWLGEAILHDIEETQKNRPRAYENIYLGIATGTGRQVFENVTLRDITDEELNQFDEVLHGVDWGYYPDPYAYGAVYYDRSGHRLYILDELYLYKHGNWEAFEKTRQHMETAGFNIYDDRITADSAEPKSVADYRNWGANCRGALKGKGSRDAGYKWLQGLNEIIIDPRRTPHAADEFTLYEYEIDKKTGEILEGYPEGQPDHFIALTRYTTERTWRKAGA